MTRLKRFLNPSILPGMERQQDHAPTRVETERENLQESVQGRELIVHGDAQSLERPPDGTLDLLAGQPGTCMRHGTVHDLTEIPGACHWMLFERPRYLRGAGFI